MNENQVDVAEPGPEELFDGTPPSGSGYIERLQVGAALGEEAPLSALYFEDSSIQSGHRAGQRYKPFGVEQAIRMARNIVSNQVLDTSSMTQEQVRILDLCASENYAMGVLQVALDQINETTEATTLNPANLSHAELAISFALLGDPVGLDLPGRIRFHGRMHALRASLGDPFALAEIPRRADDDPAVVGALALNCLLTAPPEIADWVLEGVRRLGGILAVRNWFGKMTREDAAPILARLVMLEMLESDTKESQEGADWKRRRGHAAGTMNRIADVRALLLDQSTMGNRSRRPKVGGESMVIVLDPIASTADPKKSPLQLYQELAGVPIALATSTADRLQSAKLQLNQEIPWMHEVTDRLFSGLEAAHVFHRRAIRLVPHLIVGEPSTGKSFYARRLAEVLGLPLARIPLGGSTSSILLSGCALGYSTARPSFVVQKIATTLTANPLVVLDEMNRESSSRQNGKATDAVLDMTETETASTWLDPCLLSRCDLSAVNWIGLANNTDDIDTALLSRFEIIRVGKPTPDMLPAIMIGIRRDFERKLQLEPGYVPELDEASFAVLLKGFKSGWTIRKVSRVYERLIGAQVRHRVVH